MLQAQLKKPGLNTSDKKAELEARLKEADDNELEPESELEPEKSKRAKKMAPNKKKAIGGYRARTEICGLLNDSC